MIYEIINPSDPYTMVCKDVRIAQAAGLLLGNGKYGLRDEDGKDTLPLLLFGTALPWVAKEFGSMEEFQEYIGANLIEIANCLETVMSFGREERVAYDEAIKTMAPEQAKAYRDKVHDKNRSSMNDIGGYAWQLAENMREKAKGERALF